MSGDTEFRQIRSLNGRLHCLAEPSDGLPLHRFTCVAISEWQLQQL